MPSEGGSVRWVGGYEEMGGGVLTAKDHRWNQEPVDLADSPSGYDGVDLMLLLADHGNGFILF